MAIHYPSCYVDEARNKLVEEFLSVPDVTHLMMIDADMIFPQHAFNYTYMVQQATGADVVYGNYALGNAGNSLFGPSDTPEGEPSVLVKLEPNVIYQQVVTGGTGWLLTTKAFLLKMRESYPGPWYWFDRDLTSDGKGKKGEDITFGQRATACGGKIVGTTGLLLKHSKPFPLVPSYVPETPGIQTMRVANPYENESIFTIVGNRAHVKEAASADQVGAGPTEGSKEEGPQGEASGSVCVRNPEEDGVEAEAGTRPDLAGGEEVEDDDGCSCRILGSDNMDTLPCDLCLGQHIHDECI
jgi:hypothetical protein